MNGEAKKAMVIDFGGDKDDVDLERLNVEAEA